MAAGNGSLPDATRYSGFALDEALQAASLGFGPTSDDASVIEDDGSDEINAMGEAAGIPIIDDEEPLGGGDEMARRDAHRWELDPASAEDAAIWVH